MKTILAQTSRPFCRNRWQELIQRDVKHIDAWHIECMRITLNLFEAFLECTTKCHLRSLGETDSSNTYAEWMQAQNKSYCKEATRRLQEGVPETETLVAPVRLEYLESTKWRLALDVLSRTCNDQHLESRLHAIERVPSGGRGKPAQFIPIRFVPRTKLNKHDKLLLAFDALVLSEVSGQMISFGKIIHGDDPTAVKVKLPPLVGEVRKQISKMAALLADKSPPDLVLNRHCV